jgi:hypothetical protein
MRRPACCARYVDDDGVFVCTRRLWHRGMHTGVVYPAPGRYISVHWRRDARAALLRWTGLPHVEPIDWGKR